MFISMGIFGWCRDVNNDIALKGKVIVEEKQSCNIHEDPPP